MSEIIYNLNEANTAFSMGAAIPSSGPELPRQKEAREGGSARAVPLANLLRLSKNTAAPPREPFPR